MGCYLMPFSTGKRIPMDADFIAPSGGVGRGRGAGQVLEGGRGVRPGRVRIPVLEEDKTA